MLRPADMYSKPSKWNTINSGLLSPMKIGEGIDLNTVFNIRRVMPQNK
jgi:hypothetical protein